MNELESRNETQNQRLRNYAWNYFALHAEQRMKTFNFYLILSTALISGFILGLTRIKNYQILAPIGVLLSLVSILFWKLDKRNRQLVRNGENAIKFLDRLENLVREDEHPHVLQIFAYDDRNFEKKFCSSYSAIFNSIFLVFGCLGFVAFVCCLILKHSFC